MTTRQAQSNRLLIPGYKNFQNPESIIRLEGSGNYTIIHLRRESRPLMVSQTLKYFEDQLPGFIRVSKSSLINPMFVERPIHFDTKTVHLLLKDGTSIAISRRRIVDTINRLDAQVRGAWGSN
ncbi:MAG TPA: LytTR family DNA-binding domain-containing protein [Fibrella sp.]|jgi:DNA-binding LytR/AlgR family response regulator